MVTATQKTQLNSFAREIKLGAQLDLARHALEKILALSQERAHCARSLARIGRIAAAELHAEVLEDEPRG